jgi:hypothetical protein
MSVGLDEEKVTLSNDWKPHVFRKTIRSVGGYVPRAGGACQKTNGLLPDGILAVGSGGMEKLQGISLDPFKGRIANRSSDLAKSNVVKVE